MSISSIPNLPASAAAAAAPLSPDTSATGQRSAAQALLQAVKAVNAAQIFGPENEVTFIRDRATNRLVTRVVNRDSHELVLQIPSEQVFRLADETAGG
jgi:uncharacterized FlaG/YvyC family protein